MDLPAAFTGLSIDPGTPVRAVSTEGGDGAAGACAGAGSGSDDGSDWDDWSEEGDVTAVEQAPPPPPPPPPSLLLPLPMSLLYTPSVDNS